MVIALTEACRCNLSSQLRLRSVSIVKIIDLGI